MGCVDSKPLEAFEGWWKVSVAGVNDNPVSKVGIRSRELSAYDFAAEGLNDVDASPSVLGRPAQFVRPQSLYLGGREDAGGVMDKATPRVRRALNVPAQFHTIQDALDASNDGDVIRISEGRYREALVVRKRVQLVGTGRVAETVIQAPDVALWGGAQFATLVLEASEARVCNLTLTNASLSLAVVENFCGDITLEGCAIRGGGTGVKVSNSASAIVRFCDVHHAGAHGVYVAAQACASVVKSHVFCCTSGVVVGDLGSQCSIVGSDIALCSQVGVLIHSAAQALVDDNNVARNTAAGICLTSGARAVVTSNRICGNGRVGVCVMDQSAASLTNNDLRHNGVQDEGYGLSLFVANNCEDLVSAEDNMLDASAQKPDGRLSPFLAQFSPLRVNQMTFGAPGGASSPSSDRDEDEPGGIAAEPVTA